MCTHAGSKEGTPHSDLEWGGTKDGVLSGGTLLGAESSEQIGLSQVEEGSVAVRKQAHARPVEGRGVLSGSEERGARVQLEQVGEV